MNKTYKSVWNETTGTWVAVSELEKGRSKSKRAKTAISKAILAQVAVSGLGLVGASAAFAVTDGSATGTNATAIGTGSIADVADGVAIGTGALATADVGPNASKSGAIAIGSGAEGDGSGVAIGANASAGSDSMAFGAGASATLQSVAMGASARAFNTSAVAIGDNSLASASQSLALGANTNASAADAVALGVNSVANRANTISVGNALIKRQIVNVAAGTQDNDAVNLAQIKALGLKIDSIGNPTNSFVAYDASSSNGKVTLAGGTAGTTITNVKAGVADTDAVNIAQLKKVGVTTDSSGNVTNAFVAYDTGSSNGKVTLAGGTAGTTITNVKAGVADTDAVNIAQLKKVGVTTDSSGNVTNAFVACDAGSSNGKVTLGGGTAGTTILNLAAGSVSATSKDAVNGSQLYTVASSTAAALGAGSKVNSDGSVTAPVFTVNGQNASSLQDALDKAAATGTGGGVDANAVHYDDASTKTKVTLGGTSATQKVTLSNVADGVTASDAATKGQLDAVTKQIAPVASSLNYIRFGKSDAVVAQASEKDSVAIGGNAFAKQIGSVAIGRDASAAGLNSVAIGLNSQANAADTVSFGSPTYQRRLVNIAAGEDENDAVNLGQVEKLIADAATTKGGAPVTRSLAMMSAPRSAPVSSLTPDELIVSGPTDKGGTIEALGSDAIAIGLNTHANANQSVAIGSNTSTGGAGSVAIGNSTIASSVGSTAIGVNAQATNGEMALAIGNFAQAGSTSSIVIGNNSIIGDTGSTSTANAVSIGSNNVVSGANSLVLGNSDTVSGTNTVALGNKLKVTGTNSVILGSGSDGTQSNVVSVGSKGSERKIVFVAAGTVGATSTDAVNGSQLYTLASSTAKALGTTAGTDGSVVAPSYKVGSNSYTDVGSALSALGTAVGDGGADVVKYDTSAHDKLTLGGTASAPVALSNVAAGKAPSDAVNVKQLADAGLTIGASGEVTNAFVAYENSTKAEVSLGGSNGTQIHNVAAGMAPKDAVNVSQLEALGAKIGTSGEVSNAFVTYDDTTKGTVTFNKGSATPVTLSNVAAGKAPSDAVNVKQLADAGLTLGASGEVTNAFVAYENSTKAAVSLGGSNGTQIHNVAAGTASKDAVNVTQLEALGAKIGTSGEVTNSFVAYDTGSSNATITLAGTSGTKITKLTAGTVGATSTDAVNGSQLYTLANSTAKALGTTAGTDGSVAAPSYKVGSNTYTDVGSALSALGTAVGDGGADVVKYDTSVHDQLTLGGTASAPVTLSNVAAGKAPSDAVNVKQLADAGLTLGASGEVTNAFVAYTDATKSNISLGGGSKGTQIHNLADGTAPNDAATVGQVNSLSENFKTVQTSLKYVRFGATDALTGQATGTDSVAIGGNSFATAAGALAIGRDARASALNSVAFGIGSLASAPDTVSFGNALYQRRLVNVAAGEDDNDAVNLGQVEKLIADSAKTHSLSMQSAPVSLAASTDSLDPVDLIKSGPTNKGGQIEALGSDSIAIGLNTHANADESVAIGQNTSTGGKGSVAIGNSTISSSVGSTAIGVNAQATNGDGALAIGNFAQSGSTNAVVIGNNSIVGDTKTASAALAVAIGSNNIVSASKALVLGNSVKASGVNSVVLGNDIKATGTNNVVLGSGSDGSLDNVVSVGAKGSERKIVNVATGTADTDAVNVKQLNDKVAGLSGSSLVVQDPTSKDITVASALDGAHVNFAGTAGPRELTGVANGKSDNSAATVGQLKPVVAALGGGAAVNADGSIAPPSYTVQGTKAGDVGSAVKSLDDGLTDVKAQLGASGIGLITQDGKTGEISIGGLTDGSLINVANKAGTERKITGVADGAINTDSTDAINGRQLSTVGSGLASAIGGGTMVNPDGSITQPTFTVGGQSMHNVGDALSNVDGRVTTNANDIAGIKDTLGKIGTGGGTASPDAVVYDSGAHDKLTLNKGGAAASLTNLADGNVAAGSTDAVTGNQLYATNQQISSLGDAIKNVSTTGSAVIAAGSNGGATGTAPTATGNGSLAIGNGANANGDNSFAAGNGANAGNSGATSIGAGSSAGGMDSLALGHNAQAPADNSVALGANSVADQPNTVSVGSEGSERRITNVAPGIAGTDAVNVNQLQSGLNGIARKAYSGVAAATALTMIPDVDANKTLSIGIGGGTFHGYAATAIGGTARITQNLKVRVGAGWSSSGTTVGAGAAYQW